MAGPSDWRNSLVDLSAESDDDDDDGPLTSLLSGSSAPSNSPPPQKLPCQTPFGPRASVRFASSTLSVDIASKGSAQMQNQGGSKLADNIGAGNIVASRAYTPVFTRGLQNGYNGAALDEQPDKRRKLSVSMPWMQEQWHESEMIAAPSKDSGYLSGSDGFGASILSGAAHQERSSTSACNSSGTGVPVPGTEAPSAQALHMALKDSRESAGFAGSLHREAQSLHIAKVPSIIDVPDPPCQGPLMPAGASSMGNRSTRAALCSEEFDSEPYMVVDTQPLQPQTTQITRSDTKCRAPYPSPGTCQEKPYKTTELSAQATAVQMDSSSEPSVKATPTDSRSAVAAKTATFTCATTTPHFLAAQMPLSLQPSTQLHHNPPQIIARSQAKPQTMVTKLTPGMKFYTEEEDDLIIFLKEVKKWTWREISTRFPDRNGHTVQSRYSKTLNKRDRSQDKISRATLKLPAEFAAEAVVDWDVVHQDIPGPITNAVKHNAASFTQDFTYNAPPTHRERRRRTRDAIPTMPTYEQSLGAEPGQRRPRRMVQKVNYDVKRKLRKIRAGSDDTADAAESLQSESRSESPDASEAPSLGPEHVVSVEEPLVIDYASYDARLALTASQPRQTCRKEKLPYLSFQQRFSTRTGATTGEWDQLCGREWQGRVVHVDFNEKEIEIATRILRNSSNKVLHVSSSQSPRKSLQLLLRNQPEHEIVRLAHELKSEIRTRTPQSIDAFVSDASMAKLNNTQRVERLGAVRPSRAHCSNPKFSTSSLVRQRELGLQSRRGWKTAAIPLSYQARNNVYDSIGPAYTYTGASSDVHTVAWSPNGECFAAGAVCVTDPHSMQYNRPNNLLYGNVTNKVLQELGEHSIDRPRAASGPNSSYAMYVSQDPKLYTTISSVAFSSDGQYVFAGGYDKFVSVWRTTSDGSQPELWGRLKHKADVDLLAVACHGAVVATAAKKWTSNAIKIITINETGDIDHISFHSQKAKDSPQLNIMPTTLRFEPTYGGLLLGGFGANAREDRPDTSGDICLWDVHTQQQLYVWGSSKNVFDAAFNPYQRRAPSFAVGCAAGVNVNRGTRSTVRFYDYRDNLKYTSLLELECPAMDMNDLVYCPYDDNMVAAGCTDGTAYIWDIRKPDGFLYRLRHGRSLQPLDDRQHREVTDTGVRFLSWGDNATRLYTGSSDGVVKSWDVVSSAQNVFIRDVVTLDSGIMSGAFSPDMSRLLVGEVNGSINVLEVGHDDCSSKDAEKLHYLPYVAPPSDEEPQEEHKTSQEFDSGIAIASDLLQTNQMTISPWGGFPIRQALQGPSYLGPFDSREDAPTLRERAYRKQGHWAQDVGQQCNISACQDVFKFTSEETGDSGRSADRIPDELREQWLKVDADGNIKLGKMKCAQCGRSARPSDPSSTRDDPVLCERCSFACFHCGASVQIRPETDIIHCGNCDGIWEAGTLGYECIEAPQHNFLPPNVPALQFYGEGLLEARLEGWDDGSFGDEMNALTDHYHSLTIDGPPSPPL